jgi:SAM-dependent methyltransferase
MKNEIEKRFKMVSASSTFKRIADTYHTYDKKVLDMGCGFGEYMQRFGKNSVGITTTKAEVEYGKAHAIDLRFGNVELLDKSLPPLKEFDMFWGNNLFEHLLSPHAFLVNLKQYAKNDALLILGVPMVPKIVSLIKLKKFRGSLATPHINFFTKDTFRLTVERAGWKVIDIRSFAFSSKTLDHATNSLMPHLYLVAKNDPTYTYPPKKIKEWKDDPHYTSLLEIMSNQGQ